ncbi:MAG: gliding motility-associated C-terminal domain-containing protein, partial [Flavobacteriales bacterium]|nr:gliding motility-associated C-terminal domain-containing protein [Flavobacteriales bacterium]
PAGGTLPYTFAWDNTPGFDTGPLADTLPAGTWHVTITDNQGCSIIDSVIVTQPNALLLTTDSIDILCNGLCTGVADVNTTGGTLPYTFLWDPGASNQTDSTATGLCAGTFSVTVNDINGCTNDTVVTIDEPAATLPNFAIADATCGLCDGEASSTPTGGAGTFTFNWYDTFNPSPPGNDTIFNQCAGFRNLELTDANGCIDTFTVGINNFGAPIIDSIDSVAVTCFDSCNGVATVHVQPGSGTGALTYTWTDGPPASTDTIADSLCAGVYFVQVEDALGCIVVGSTTITSPTDIVSLISGVNVLCFGDNDGEARTAPFGGVAGYTHLWTPGGGTTDTITGLVAGTYIDTITDFSGCFIVDTIVITEPPVFNVSLVDSTNITCFGVCNGTITVTSTGGTGLYTYAWNTVPLQITPVATGICAGVPTKVVVTDGQGCQDSLTVTLSEPTDLTSSITDSNNISCFGLNNGTATVTPVGGTAPYTYAWNNSPDFDTDSLADSLFSDTVYCVAITDSLGCQDTTCVTLSQPATLTANITDSTNISCNGLCNGDATVTAAGGSGTYTYSWDNAPGNDSTILADTLCAGVLYHITVTDSLGCQASDSITLAEPTSLTVVISDSSNISCNGVCDGTAVGFAAGGSAPYTYNWSPGGQTNDSITGLCAGTIDTLIVTDSLLCSDTVMVTLSEPAVLTITVFDSVNATCFGVCDGIGRTITAGGVAPYTYTWSLSADTLDSAIALCADTMNIVTVTDSNGCIAMDSVMLSQPLEIFATITDSTDATCFGVCDGQAVLTVAGGNAPLSLMWCNGELGDTAFALCADSILCGVVVDSLGCTDTASFTISQPTQVAITFTDSTGALCNGGCEGDATISVTGGTPPYLITWSNGDSGVFADSLCAGYAIVTVTDSIGCISIDSINILAPSLFAVDTVSTTAASCDSLCDAMAVVFGTGGTTPYTFIWSDSLTVNDTAINLCASTYIVTGIDSNGCTSIDTVVIVGPAGLTISVDTLTTISCFGGSDGAATVVATGGVGTHTFSWVDTSATPPTFAGPGPNDTTVTGLFAGIYFATVEDANGCIATVPVIINEPAPLQANVCAVNNVTCNLSCDGSAQVCPIGGTPIYTFQWDDPLGQTDSIAIDLCSGSYAVTVTDGNGCIALDSLIIIDQPDLLSCTFFDVLNTGCGVDSANGGAEAIGNGGTPPYNYLWNTTPANNTDSVGNLLAGNYNVLVTDANGCTSVCGISITDTSNMAAAITDSSMVTCNGACDGSAVVTATGSTPPYIATWVDFDSIPIGQINDTASGLCGGLYRVIVKSAAGCFRSLPILITQPDTLVAAIADTLSPLCNADSNGRLVVSQTGGTGPYTYQWFDSSGTSIGTSDTLDSIPAGPYCILVTDSNGCQDSICVVLTEPAQLFVSVINTVNPACSNTCDGMVVASAVGGTQPYAFLWLPDSIVNDSLIGVCVDTFVVTVTDTNSCFAADTVILSPIVTVTANAGADNTFCEGELVTIVGSGGTSYEWFVNSVFAGNSISTNDTLITSPSSSGWLTYILVVDDSICSDTDSVAVFIIPVAVDVCCDATIALGECIGLTGVATNGLIYSWSPGITLDDSTIFNPEACPMVSVTYVLTATNDSGCVGTDSLRILVQPDIPDGFTPQGDAYNEVWEIALLDSYPKASVQVYNRWGQLVFDSPEGNQYATKFDGTHNGKDLPVGTYYYVINLNDGITDALTGPITIMR